LCPCLGDYIIDSSGKSVSSFDARAPINSSAYFHNEKIYFGSDHGLHALSF